MMQERMVSTSDGTKLYLKSEVVENCKGVVIIVHGLCEHQGRYDHVAVRLLEAGYGVYRYDHRGHGRSEGQRVFFRDFHQLPDDLKMIYDLAKAEIPDKPVFILGHSMGGMCTTLFATKYPDLADGIVLSGALSRYNKTLFGSEPIQLPEDHMMPNSLGDGVCSDPEVKKAYAEDPYVEKEISVGLMNMVFKVMDYLKERPMDFIAPVLILHGAEDGLVSEKDSRDLYGDIGSKDKTLHIYAKLFHEILNEPCKQEIITEIIQWLDRRVNP